MTRAFLIALALSGCVSYTDTPDALILHASTGAVNANTRAAWYNDLICDPSGACDKLVILDGPMVSADAMLPFHFRHCYTERATLSLHAASMDFVTVDEAGTAILRDLLPDAIDDMADKAGAWDSHLIGHDFSNADLVAAYPEGRCE